MTMWSHTRTQKLAIRGGKSATAAKRRPLVEQLEKRELLSVSLPLKFDFGTETSPKAPGYIGESVNAYSSSIGYGWETTVGVFAQNRNTTNPLTAGLIKGFDGTFLVNLANGTYDISPLLGDAAYNTKPMDIWINGTLEANGLSLAKNEFANPTYKVAVTDGQLRFHIKMLARGYFSLDALVVAPHASPLTASAGQGEAGKEGSAISFAGSALGGFGTLSYQWNFGDGATAAGTLTPLHTYVNDGVYTATLTVTDVLGSVAKSTTQVTVNNVAPTVNVGGPYSGAAGTAICFTSSASDPDPTDTLSYSWNFGDGSTSTLQMPTHTYPMAGNYTVSLTVSDQEGGVTTVTTAATLTSSAPLKVSAGPNQTTSEGIAVTFSGDANGGVGVLTYQWSFGDGTSASATLTPTHTFTSDGSYTATLTVTDSQNNVASSTTQVTVNNVAPTVSIGGPYIGTTAAAIDFTGSGSVPDTADTLSYSWNFGDGTASAQQYPSHTFAAGGNYTVTLTVTDSEGTSTSATTTASVSSVLVGAFDSKATITTPYLTIPNFGAQPTIVSVKSGRWSDPTIWSTGRIPIAGDVVDIGSATTVIYDLNSTVELHTIVIQNGATLNFRTDIDTQVHVGNFLVVEGGTLTIGTAANPVAANVMAQIFIANQAINTATDPNQFGTGLIMLGTITTYGAAKTAYATLSLEPKAGDTVLHFATPVAGWQVGDVLELPDTRQLTSSQQGSNFVPQWEQLTIQSVSADGSSVTLTAPLLYGHLGARDANGVLRYLPQIANVSRNVMIASEDVTAGVSDTRGYTLFTNHANVNVQNTGFCELGRSTGNNQVDRTPMTILDLFGPTTPQANGYQFTLAGNVVNADCLVCTSMTAENTVNSPYQWGIVLRNSFYGLIQNNVVYNVFGAGIGTEDGASSHNVFDGNFVMRVNGTDKRADTGPIGTQGAAFWFAGPDNYVRNNVATDIGLGVYSAWDYGYVLYFTGRQANVPLYQGADPSQSGLSKVIDIPSTPILDFSNNEVYGATANGLTYWYVNSLYNAPLSGGPSTIEGLRIWNVYNMAVFGYYSNKLTLDRLVGLNNPSQAGNAPAVGVYLGDYLTQNFTVQNSDIEGFKYGFYPSARSGGTQTIQNSYLRNRINIEIDSLWTSHADAGDIPSRTVIIRNVKFDAPPGLVLHSIVMSYPPSLNNGSFNLIQSDQVFVYDYNQIAGENFRVYYTQQAADFAVPQSIQSPYGNFLRVVAFPVAGLTNQQAWAEYGIDIAGEVAPAGAYTMTGIDGLVF